MKTSTLVALGAAGAAVAYLFWPRQREAFDPRTIARPPGNTGVIRPLDQVLGLESPEVSTGAPPAREPAPVLERGRGISSTSSAPMPVVPVPTASTERKQRWQEQLRRGVRLQPRRVM